MNKICLVLLLFLFIVFLFPSVVFAQTDTTSPLTTAVINPSSPNGENGWYTSSVDVTLNSVDLESGVKEMNWRLNNGTWTKKTFTQTLNMVINSSFETGTDGWNFVPFNNSFGERTNEFAKIDQYSVKIRSLENGLSFFTNNQNYVVVSPWKTVSLGVWLKGQNILGEGAFYKIYILTDTGAKLLYTSPVQTGTFDWVYLTKDVVISSDTAYGLYFELSLNGVGEIYFDGIYAAYASEQPRVALTLSNNGINTYEFYAIDFANNTESTKSINFKIDSIAPTNWQHFETERSGDAHTFISRVDVSDNVSGLNADFLEFQYSPLSSLLWGYFTDYENCEGSFEFGGWLTLPADFESGALAGNLESPPIDYCNANWFFCKGNRFKVKDLAGNDSTKEICLNGPWVKNVGGDVVSRSSIDMLSSSMEDNTDALVIACESLSNFSSSKNWLVSYYPFSFNTEKYSYDYLVDKYNPENVVSKLPITNGIFKTSNDFQVNTPAIPQNYSQQQFSNILFVNGDLVILKNLDMKSSSGTIFVVKGDVLINRTVATVDGFFIVGGVFNTSYNGGFVDDALKLTGGVLANRIELNRSFSFSILKNQGTPSEEFIYDPKYLIDFTSVFGDVNIKWRELFD
ncbi:MAG: hypothetical protein ABIB98_03505 [bacterium]